MTDLVKGALSIGFEVTSISYLMVAVSFLPVLSVLWPETYRCCFSEQCYGQCFRLADGNLRDDVTGVAAWGHTDLRLKCIVRVRNVDGHPLVAESELEVLERNATVAVGSLDSA